MWYGRELSFPAAATISVPFGDGLEDLRIGIAGKDLCAERHGNDRATVRDGPLDPGQNPLVSAVPFVGQDFTGEYFRIGRKPVPWQLPGHARTARRADAMGAVTVAILNLLTFDE
jgi:hypothetical protein